MAVIDESSHHSLTIEGSIFHLGWGRHVLRSIRSVEDLLMSKARSVRALCGLIVVILFSGFSLPGCGGSSTETEVLEAPKPREGRDSMDAYKADMKNKPKPTPGK
jgi:hypothetical protein